MNLETIISKAKLNINDLIAVYPYGSRVYGTANKNSDYDFIVITKNKTTEQYSDNLININFYTPEEHQERLNDHEISALECYFLDPNLVLFDRQHPLNKNNSYTPFTFKLDKSKLRHSLCAKSSNSWVKAKKKLTVEKDYDLMIGKKSLFHAIRIIVFGVEIASHGKIVDYRVSNDIYKEIMGEYESWSDLFKEYKTRYNHLLSDFRELAPKDLTPF